MSRLIVAASLALFLLFAAAWIHLPGPQHDELLHVPVLKPEWRASALYSVQIAGHTLPVMIMSYNGTLKGWLLSLWFLLAPLSVPGYRAFGVAVGAVTVWLVWRFARRYWGEPVALLATGLLATDPSFVQTIRLDYGPVALAHFCKMAGLWQLSRWLDGGSRLRLAAGMFLFGLGVWDKANFIWFLAGLAVTAALLFPREALRRWRALPLAVAALAAGAAPFLLYNATHAGQTWQERGQLQLQWSKLLQAQGTFNGDFMSVMTGEDHLESSPPAPGAAHLMYRLGRLRQTILLPLLALALLALPLSLRLGRRRALLFPLLLSLATYAAMFVSFDGGSSVHHVVMLEPFPLLFLAASLWTPVERWPRWRHAAVALVALAVAVNVSVNARHLAVYTRTGGTGPFSDAVYRLAPHLAQHPGAKLYALDWGFSNPLTFLTGRPVDDIFFLLNEPNPSVGVKLLGELMRNPNNIFLLHTPQRTLYPRAAQAFFALADQGIPMRQVAVFEERTGEQIYQVYRAGQTAGARPEAPPEVTVRFYPQRVAPRQEYLIEIPELAGAWIDLVYHIDDVTAGTATRFCQLDAAGRARLTVPVTHPAATVRVTRVRQSGGEWRPARGSITVTP